MSSPGRLFRPVLLVLAILGAPIMAAAQTPDLTGGAFLPQALGPLIKSCSRIAVFDVEKVDRDDKVIHFKKVTDLRGGYPARKVALSVHDDWVRDADSVLQWAERRQTVVVFQYRDDIADVCFGNTWYMIHVHEDPEEWSVLNPLGEFRRTYVGSTVNLRKHVTDILAGKQAVITVHGGPEEDSLDNVWNEQLDWVWGKRSKVLRARASFEIDNLVHSEESRYFVGWGVGDAGSVPGLLKALGSKNSYERAEAAEDLGDLGAKARAAIPKLREALNDPEGHVRINGAEALLRIDPTEREALPVLLKSLKAETAPVRRSGMMTLAGLGTHAAGAIAEITERFEHDSDVRVRRAAGNAVRDILRDLVDFRPAARTAVPALARVLTNDREPRVRLWAAQGLLQCGVEARPARPALFAALKKKERSATFAAMTLVRLGPGSFPLLEKALLDEKCQEQIEQEVITEAAGLGPGGRALAPIIAARLLDSEDLQTRGLEALERFDADFANHVASVVLGKVVSADRVAFRLGLLDPLMRFPATRPLLPPELRKLLLRHKEYRCVMTAVRTLGELGPEARSELPFVRELLKHKDRPVRLAAAKAIWQIDQPVDEAVLIPILEQGGWPSVRLASELMPKAKQAVPVLTRTLQSSDEHIACASCVMLSRLGSGARSAVPALRKRFKDENSLVRTAAAAAVLTFDKEDADALAIVRAAGKVQERRGDAGLLLLMMNEKLALREARPILMEIARGDHDYVEEETVAAFAKLGEDGVPLLKAVVAAQLPNSPDAAVALYRMREDHGPLVAVLARRPEAVLYLREDVAFKDRARKEVARVTVPWLLRAIRDEQLENSMRAGRALRRFDPDTADKVAGPAEECRVPWDNLTADEFAELWKDLGHASRPRAYRAVWTLTLARKPAVDFLAKRLAAVPRDVPKRTTRLIADLDDANFKVRKEALEELEKLRFSAEPALRRALAKQPSLEVKTNLERLLIQLDPEANADALRHTRALEALGYSAAGEARSLLETIAGGADDSIISRTARKHLESWDQWKKLRPGSK
jgi:HEAT repeat protein